MDDEDDGDYAPKSTGKKGNRAARARTVKQRGAATSKTAPKPSPVNVPKDKKYSGDRLRNIVEQAVTSIQHNISSEPIHPCRE